MAAQESALAGSGLSAGRAIPAEDNVEVGKVFGTKMPAAGRPMDKEPLTTALQAMGSRREASADFGTPEGVCRRPWMRNKTIACSTELSAMGGGCVTTL